MTVTQCRLLAEDRMGAVQDAMSAKGQKRTYVGLFEADMCGARAKVGLKLW
jgi:hypothetical protein